MPQTSDPETAIAPTRKSHGGGLWAVRRSSGVYYTYRYRDALTGRGRETGIGPAKAMTLQMARKRVNQLKGQLYSGGGDPIDKAREDRQDALRELKRQITFAEFASQFIRGEAEEWRSRKHAKQWTATLNTYCVNLMRLQVSKITSDDIVEALAPIWKAKYPTASRVRSRIEIILDAAAARGLRDKENPARYSGNLEHRLKAPKKAKVIHRPALPYTEVADFIQKLEAKSCVSSKALLLQIFTATRPSEAAAARWNEFNLDEGYWLIPRERMKAFLPHKVPLPRELVAHLQQQERHPSGYLFPGTRGGFVCTDAMLRLAKRTQPGITSHGFRSTFRDWVADMTDFREEIAEAALAHKEKDKTVAAYRRTTQYVKRERLMQEWYGFCHTPQGTGTVIDINSGRRSLAA